MEEKGLNMKVTIIKFFIIIEILIFMNASVVFNPNYNISVSLKNYRKSITVNFSHIKYKNLYYSKNNIKFL
jgi:hypothetical protein